MTCAETKLKIYVTASSIDVLGTPNVQISARIVEKERLSGHSGWKTCSRVTIPTYLATQLSPLPDTLALQLDALNNLLFRVGCTTQKDCCKGGDVAIQLQNTNSSQSLSTNSTFVGTELGTLIQDVTGTVITLLVKTRHSVRCKDKCSTLPFPFCYLMDACSSITTSSESEKPEVTKIKTQELTTPLRLESGVEALAAELVFERTED